MSACATPPTDGLPSCAAVEAITADETYANGIATLADALSLVMFPVAAWAGGALIGRELENGTARLAWTQSVSPLRWLAAKLAVPALLLTAGTGGLVLLNDWARGDGNPNLVGDWYDPDAFVSTGPVAVGYALAGLALGALAGLVWRRALHAAGAALAASLLLHSVLERYRESLWPAVTRTEAGTLELPRSAFQVTWADPTRHGVRLSRATFHPESHFWPLQYVETGLLLAVAGTATAAAFVLLARPWGTLRGVRPALRGHSGRAASRAPSTACGQPPRPLTRPCGRPRAAPRYPARHVSVTIDSDELAKLGQ
ncbi:hypothetical protein [Streptomyces luteogriseus]|uniref:hypothetical protein n=1 Tax=Streptomyces luteogriseus TaxID=68233 RepID=UPI003812AC53